MSRLPVNVERKIVIFDAEGQSIGRVATGIARVLMGKHKPTYEANRDHGDNVEVRNAAKVKLTGHKIEQKEYYRYSGYPGGLKTKTLKTIMAKDPADAIRRAVSRMLPKNRLRIARMKRLKVRND